MTYEHFLKVCNALGDQNLPEGERWRSISLMHIDNLPIFNFQDMYKAGKAYFIGDGTGATGFVFHEHIPAELSVKGDPITSFVDLDVVFSVHFVMQKNFKTAANIAKAIDDSFAPTVSVSFDKTDYGFEKASDIVKGIKVLITDPAALVTLGYFSTRELAEAATAPADSDMKLTDIGIGVPMYLRAFVDEPFTTSDVAIASLVINSKDADITYKFLNADGTLIKSATVDFGSTIVPPTENPIKPADTFYSYVFAGWRGYVEGMIATHSVTFVAQFTAVPKEFTYTFRDEDGTVLKTETAPYGTTIIPPASPTKEGNDQYSYTFKSWTGYTTNMQLSGNCEFVATYTQTVKQYTYRFLDHDGTELKKSTVVYGTVITPPSNPTRESTDMYDYTFVEFDGFTNGMTITEDISFTAVYSSTIRSYTYKFLDEDGTILKEETALYGDTIVAPTSPSKVSTDQYTYTFDKWTGFTSGMQLTKDISFTATYTSTVNNYTYTFYDENGTTVLKTLEAPYGTVITPPADPTKAATAQYTYAFDEWVGYTANMKLTKDISFKASYTSTVNKYTYTFYDEDGSTVLKTATVDYGTTITPPADPTKAATAQYTYTFDSWSGYTTGMTIAKDVSFTATYKSAVNKYTYTFYDEDGTTVLKTASVDYGTTITPPVDPTKESDNANTYTFSGWAGYTSGMTISKNVSFTATYTATAIMYKATFKNEDGTVYETVNGEYGDTITLPTAPTKEADDTNTYEFDHWDGYTTNMTFSGDHEFTAVFTATPIIVEPEPTPDEGGGEEPPTE